MSETITVILEEIKCLHDTKEKQHDDIYLHLYAYHDGKEIDLGADYWTNPLKMNDGGDNNAYINTSINLSKSFVDKLKISMRDKDTNSDSLSAEDNPSNWDLIDNQEIRHDSALKGTLTFAQSNHHADKKGEYTLSYKIVDKPIPTLRVLGVYCEQATVGGDCAGAIEMYCNHKSDAAERAAKVVGKSPRPRAKAMAKGLRAASWFYKGLAACAEWISAALEGDDDVYMQRTDGGVSPDGGPFFPPDAANYKMHKVTEKGHESNEIVLPPDGEVTEEYVFNKHNTVFFQETYGEYFRIPLDDLSQQSVTIQLKDEDHRSDDAIGALTITQADYDRLKDEGAQVEVAAIDFSGNGNAGAVYYICYSVGLENWAMPANTDLQEQTGLPVGGACYHITSPNGVLSSHHNPDYKGTYLCTGAGGNSYGFYDWTVEYLNEDIIRLVCLGDNLVAYADGLDNGDAIKTGPKADSGSQRWRIKDMGDGTVTLTNVDSNKLLHATSQSGPPFCKQYSKEKLDSLNLAKFSFHLVGASE